MKIKVTIKKNSAAAKIIEASKAEKEAFKKVVQTGKTANHNRTKKERLAKSV